LFFFVEKGGVFGGGGGGGCMVRLRRATESKGRKNGRKNVLDEKIDFIHSVNFKSLRQMKENLNK